jgi:predicted O-methyltransferase YrrM
MAVLKRGHWLEAMIKRNRFTVGAEIGCFEGKTTNYLLKRCQDLTIYAVDLWEWRPELFGDRERELQHLRNHEAIKREFDRKTRSYGKRVKVLQGISWEMAKHVADESLDFVFIDADHGYEAVKKDILAWVPKVHERGIISGHDIDWEGVKQACDELLPGYRKTGINQVWMIKRKSVQW